MFQILVVEPDTGQRNILKTALKEAGYQAYLCCDTAEALELLDRRHVDLMITDLALPQADGCQLIRELRDADYMFPVLVTSLQDTLPHKRDAFLAGADDFLAKPFATEELLLRVYALLRRAGASANKRLQVGDVILEYDKLCVCTGGRTILLPQKEFYVLYKLLSYPQRVFTRQQLMDEIWGLDAKSDERTVDVHIKRLREKLGDIPEFTIVTIRGLGYKAVLHTRQEAVAVV